MDFRADQHLEGSIDEVEAALVDPSFYATLDDLTTISAPEILETVRDDREIVQRTRYRFIAELPGAVTAVVDPRKLTWIEEARYDLSAHVSTHAILPDHYADRLRARYHGTLVPVEGGSSGDGTMRTVTGEVTVRMALVGRRVERVIVDGLKDSAAEQAVHLDQWLRDRR